MSGLHSCKLHTFCIYSHWAFSDKYIVYSTLYICNMREYTSAICMHTMHIFVFSTPCFEIFLCLFFLAMQVIGFSTIFMGVSGVARTYYKYSKVSFFWCARVCFWRARVCFWCARVCFWFASVCCIDTHWLQALLNLYLSFLVGLLFLMGDGCGGYRWYRLSPILLFCLNSYVMPYTCA